MMASWFSSRVTSSWTSCRLRRIWADGVVVAFFGGVGEFAFQFAALPQERLGALMQGERLQVAFAGVLGCGGRGCGPQAGKADLLVERFQQRIEAFGLQLLDEDFARQARAFGGGGVEHRRPEALQIAIVVFDRGNLVIFFKQQLRMVDDGGAPARFRARAAGPDGR